MDKNPTLNQSKLDQFSNHLSIRNSKPNILFIFNSQIADYNAAVAAASKQHLIWHFGRSISKLILTTAVVDLKVGRVEGGVQQGVEWYAYIATCACRTCTTTTMMVPKNGSVQRITYIYTSTSLLICAQRAHERNGPFFFSFFCSCCCARELCQWQFATDVSSAYPGFVAFRCVRCVCCRFLAARQWPTMTLDDRRAVAPDTAANEILL